MTQYTYGLTRLLGHGHAFTQRSAVPSPAVATGFDITVASPYWEIGDALSFTLATDNNAANRVVTLTIKDGDGVALATVPANAALTASKTGTFTFLADFSSSLGATDGPFLSIFPAVMLQPSFKVSVTSTNLQAGDQFAAIRWVRQRFVTGTEGYFLGVTDEAKSALAYLAEIAAVES